MISIYPRRKGHACRHPLPTLHTRCFETPCTGASSASRTEARAHECVLCVHTTRPLYGRSLMLSLTALPHSRGRSPTCGRARWHRAPKSRPSTAALLCGRPAHGGHMPPPHAALSSCFFKLFLQTAPRPRRASRRPRRAPRAKPLCRAPPSSALVLVGLKIGEVLSLEKRDVARQHLLRSESELFVHESYSSFGLLEARRADRRRQPTR